MHTKLASYFGYQTCSWNIFIRIIISNFFSYNVKKIYLVCQRCFCLSICRYITLLYIDSYIPFYKRWSMNSQQIHRPSRDKGQYHLDCDKGQTEHLSSMSSLWRTTRMSRWMTPTLTTVLIRPFLNLFFCKWAATDVLKITSIPLDFTPSTNATATDKLQTINPRGLFQADWQVGARDFFSGRTVRKLRKQIPCECSLGKLSKTF